MIFIFFSLLARFFLLGAACFGFPERGASKGISWDFAWPCYLNFVYTRSILDAGVGHGM